jgi:hypothetical protein
MCQSCQDAMQHVQYAQVGDDYYKQVYDSPLADYVI